MISIARIQTFLVSASILIIVSAAGCELASSPETPDYELNSELAAKEWAEVKQAVNTMFEEANVFARKLQSENRIDWENSANSPDIGTRNMLGAVTDKGERPLIALNPYGSGTAIQPVSYYLGRNRTNSLY